jgi:hypothetical protein
MPSEAATIAGLNPDDDLCQYLAFMGRMVAAAGKPMPQVPTDPFDGRPLRYVVKDDEYLVYSIGTDGVDDGGQGDVNPDIVFRVERKETNR